MSEENKVQGYVYAILNPVERCVKIGFSIHPERRLRGIQTGSATRLMLLGYWPGTFEDEREFHERYNSYRTSGEWFRLNNYIISYLERTLNIDLSEYRSDVVHSVAAVVAQGKRIEGNTFADLEAHLEFPVAYFTCSEFVNMLRQAGLISRDVSLANAASRIAESEGIVRVKKYQYARTNATGEQVWPLVSAYPRHVIEKAYYSYAIRRQRTMSVDVMDVIKASRVFQPLSRDYLDVAVAYYPNDLHWQ